MQNYGKLEENGKIREEIRELGKQRVAGRQGRRT